MPPHVIKSLPLGTNSNFLCTWDEICQILYDWLSRPPITPLYLFCKFTKCTDYFCPNRRTLVTTTDSSQLRRESRQSKERPTASCWCAAPLSNSEPLFCRKAEFKSRLCFDEKWNLVLWKPLSFHPNKSLPWIKAFPKLWSITRRECNVFDVRLLQISKVTHVSVSAKLLVAKLDWGPLLIFEPKDAM